MYLEHIADGSTEGMVDESVVKIAPMFNKRRDGSVIRAERKYSFHEVAQGRVQ